MPNKLPRKSHLLSFARELRKYMTAQERHLWFDCLRYCRPRFRRQEIIGHYIADFYCHAARLVVELDGSQHFEKDALSYDAARSAYFCSLGICVMRFSNYDIEYRFAAVCEQIWQYLDDLSLHPSVAFGDSSPQGEP